MPCGVFPYHLALPAASAQATGSNGPTHGGVVLRIAVVGCGYWGSKHVRVLHSIPEVSQVVAVDLFEDRLASLKSAFPSLITFPDLESAIDHVDAVVLATPPTTHAKLALQALAEGKSVLVEKPLATTSGDALRMIQAADDRSLVLMVGHTFEYNAAVWKLRELIQDGELGRVYYVDSARLNLGLYQPDVNVIWDLAPHDVSIMNYVLGATPVSVQAWGSKHGHHFLEDVAYLRLLYADPEVTANIHVSWLDPCKVRRTTVVGASKMAVYNDLSADEPIRIFDKGVVAPEDGATLQNIPMSYRYGEIRAPYVSFVEPLGVQDREFVSCVLSGERPRTDGYSGLSVVQALEGAQVSLSTGRPVSLAEAAVLADAQSELVRAS
jgi:predicted dehydrogenase